MKIDLFDIVKAPCGCIVEVTQLGNSRITGNILNYGAGCIVGDGVYFIYNADKRDDLKVLGDLAKAIYSE